MASTLRGWLAERTQDVLTLAPADPKLWPGTGPERAETMLRRDLEAAGIAVTTEDGTLDFHCLRRTFATNLARAGVSPKAAQEPMRHSNINLTLTTCTNLRLSDVAAELERLPALTPNVSHVATGTAGSETGSVADGSFSVAPLVAPLTAGFRASHESSVTSQLPKQVRFRKRKTLAT